MSFLVTWKLQFRVDTWAARTGSLKWRGRGRVLCAILNEHVTFTVTLEMAGEAEVLISYSSVPPSGIHQACLMGCWIVHASPKGFMSRALGGCCRRKDNAGAPLGDSDNPTSGKRH